VASATSFSASAGYSTDCRQEGRMIWRGTRIRETLRHPAERRLAGLGALSTLWRRGWPRVQGEADPDRI